MATNAVVRAKKIAKGAFLSPWQNPQRAKIMLIGLLANMGYGCLSFALNYAMATQGLEQSLIYQMFRMALLGFVAIPACFWFCSKVQSPFWLFLLQIAGLGFFLIDPTSGFWNGIAITIAFAPYLALHQYRFAKFQSRENRGNEAALNSTLITISYSFGLFLGGLLLQHDMLLPAAIGGALATIISTASIYTSVPGRNNPRKVWTLLGHNKPSTRLSFFFGLFNPMVDGCMPVWMHTLGISPLGASLNMSLRPMIGFMLTPIAGWLIQKKGMKAGSLGGLGMLVGWLFIAAAHRFPWTLAIGMAVLSLGSNLLAPMEVSRWFKRRSSAGVIAREILVASGRVPAYGMGILVAFFAPLAYPLLGLGISTLFMIGMRPTRKRH